MYKKLSRDSESRGHVPDLLSVPSIVLDRFLFGIGERHIMAVSICEFCHNRHVKAMFKIVAAYENFPAFSTVFVHFR
jgi:hypothetical protein